MRSPDPAEKLPDDLARFWFLTRRVAALMDRQGETLLRAELGMSLAQFLVLSVVDAYPGPLSQQAVADRLGLTKGTVSRQIDAAVHAGLMTVEVSAHARREHALALTDAGTDLVRRGDKLTERSRDLLLEAVDPGELGLAVRVLARLLDALNGPGPGD